jgi:hypothetical protein
MRIRPLFAWYDLWIGAFWDRTRRRLYILPLPCVGVVIQFKEPESIELYRGVTFFPSDKFPGTGQQCNTSIRVRTQKPPTAMVDKIGPTGSRLMV